MCFVDKVIRETCVFAGRVGFGLFVPKQHLTNEILQGSEKDEQYQKKEMENYAVLLTFNYSDRILQLEMF